MLDINNNPDQYLGNPPSPAGDRNPVYPNPCSVVEMRQAIAYLTDRGQLLTYIGAGLYTPIYTTVPPSMGLYMHPEIKPGGALRALCYLYSRENAEAKLDAGGFPVNPVSGWRFWDRNKDGIEQREEYLRLRFVIRDDHQHRRDMGDFIASELEAVKVRVNRVYMTRSAARIEVNNKKEFHLYLGGGYSAFGFNAIRSPGIPLTLPVIWPIPEPPFPNPKSIEIAAAEGLTSSPDHLVLWNWDYYWHLGCPYNYAGCNDTAFNEYSYAVKLANNEDEAKTYAWLAQEAFAEKVLSVPLWSYVGSKAMSRCYTGGNLWKPIGDDEDPYRGKYWEGAFNVVGYGVDSNIGFLNMHPRDSKRGNGEMTIRWGFETPYICSFNPLYAHFMWDQCVLGLIYNSLIEFAEEFSSGTYTHPVYGTCSKIGVTLRPDATWHDGTPVTAADVYFTLVELDDILRARGMLPPRWIGNVDNILSFRIIDAYNFEILLDAWSIYAENWIGGSLILPKHIWKPLAESGNVDYIAPDPNQIGSGPWRLGEYVPNAWVFMYANKPGSTVTVAPYPYHTGSEPVTSPKGYSRYYPPYALVRANETSAAKVGYKAQQNLNFTLLNTCANDAITITLTIKYNDEVIKEGTYQIPNGTLWSWPQDIIVTKKNTISLLAHVDSPPELAGSYTWSRLTWGTLKEDIAGSTFYDDIGWSNMTDIKLQLRSPDIKVDIKDVALAAGASGAYPGHARWDLYADINGDYKIDIKDIAAIAKKFGWVG